MCSLLRASPFLSPAQELSFAGCRKILCPSPPCSTGGTAILPFVPVAALAPRDALPPPGLGAQLVFVSPSGLHPHQTPAPMANPGLYPPPVSMPPGQPPPQQLLAPTYFSPPGVMNFGNPGYPYPPGALPPPPPPHLYSNTQVSRGCVP